MKTFKQFISEIHTEDDIYDKPETNKHGQHVVYSDGSYEIHINKIGDATNATVHHRPYFNENSHYVGELHTSKIHKDLGHGEKQYLNVNYTQLGDEGDEDCPHKGRGLGTLMYKALLKHSHPDVAGIASKLSDRDNKREIPKIYKRLGADEPHAGYQTIHKDSSI